VHRLGVFVAALAALAAGCGAPPSGESARGEGPRTVRIAAAADLRYALDEIIAAFEAEHQDVTVAVSYGSSGTFFAQLQRGAPFDVFLSADVSYPRQLDDQQLTLAGSTFTYAVGRIVLWVRNDSRLDVSRGFDALLDPAVTHVAIANPEHAPYGRAARAALEAAGVLDRVQPKLVLGENVSQTMQFAQSGSADAGIVALSLAMAPTVAGEGRYWEVPPDLYPRMEQGGTVLKTAADPDAARAFVTFLQSDAGRGILRRFGFSASAQATADRSTVGG
jgi:molybdate transport system substrate-binding protein